jgi:predicted nucleic acid-binding protein
LQGYFVTATRKLHIDAGIARRKVELFAHFDLVEIALETVLGAIDLHRLHQLSFWDALIVRSALDSGCSELITEDLSHRQRLDGLRILNPYE